MKSLLLSALIAAAYVSVDVPTGVPSGNWVLGKGDDLCRASRIYLVGKKAVTLSIQSQLTRKDMTVRVSLPTDKLTVMPESARILIANAPAEADRLHPQAFEPLGTAAYAFTLKADEYSRLLDQRELTINSKPLQARFSLDELFAVDANLAGCASELLVKWGLPKDQQLKIAEFPKPREGELFGYFRADDYPAGALSRSAQGSVGLVLNVDATGTVKSCRIVATSGDPDLDSQSCEVLSKRARLDPARDTSGKAIPGILYARITWRIGI